MPAGIDSLEFETSSTQSRKGAIEKLIRKHHSTIRMPFLELETRNLKFS